ncbi:MAG: formylglycine-generating enzyme family protein, partial [Planctomycetaceae bacterium]
RWQGPRNSVEELNRADAERFCQKITELMRAAKLLGDDEEIRLPTEAEWEYCCRAGTTTAYSFGDEARADGDEGDAASVLDEYAWHTGNAAGNDPPVGALKPNPWGLYDMHGYLWEFVADDWHDGYEKAPADGGRWRSDAESPNIVLRGGSWQERYEQHRSASRRAVPRDFHNDAVGFRCVRAKVATE